jgi:signal transduction histidine kinase
MADGANEGLTYLEENPDIDCVMCSYSLPGMDGLELIQLISSQLGIEVPCILFARHGGESIASRAIQNGADEYFSKQDFSPKDIRDTLANRIRTLVERERKTQALKRQNERLEDFASAVSHDLRNPLNVAQGRAQLLQDQYDSEHLDAVTDSLDRMEAMIEDMLELARGNRQEVELSAVALESLATETWDRVETHGADLIVESDFRFEADEARFKRVLENLFRNAVEHGGESVTVTVGANESGIYIADDGPGIPPERRDKVFEQGHTTNKDGTGFGLRFVKDIVEAHGWGVAVVESSDGGAQFNISIPEANSESQNTTPRITDFS